MPQHRKTGIALKKLVGNAALASSIGVLASCAAYKVPTSDYGPKPYDPYREIRQKAVESRIYNYVPRKREQLRLLDLRWATWCLAGNEDDGIFGEYSDKVPYSTNINFGAYCSWCILRNPLHNFNNYIIGSSDWKRHYNCSVVSFGGKKIARVFSNAAKWPKRDEPFFDIGFNDFKPYLKFNPWITDFFFGWRNRGGFEIKVRADLKKVRKKTPADRAEIKQAAQGR